MQGVQLGSFCTVFFSFIDFREYHQKRNFCSSCLSNHFQLKRISNGKVRVVAGNGFNTGKWTVE